MTTQSTIEGFRLSPLQLGAWMRYGGTQGRPTQGVIRLHGSADESVLEAALLRTIERYEILRSTFPSLAGMETPLQAVSEAPAMAYRTIDAADRASEGPENLVGEILDEEAREPFDLENGPVIRATLYRLAPDERLLTLTMPVMCADGPSVDNLFAEICRSYAAHFAGESVDEEVVQYVDFAEWQHELTETEEGREGLEFWADQDLSALRPLALPGETSTREDRALAFDPTVYAIDPVPATRVDELATRFSVSGEAVLLACWKALIWRLVGRPKVVVEAFSSGRGMEPLAGALGLFGGSLPLQSPALSRGTPFRKLVRVVEEKLQASRQWEDSFPGIAETLFNASYRALPPVAFEYASWPAARAVNGTRFQLLGRRSFAEPFRLKLVATQRDDSVALELLYDASRFEAVEAARLAARLAAVLDSVYETSDVRLGDVEILGHEERAMLLYDWNATSRPWSEARPLPSLFEAHAATAPTATAVAFAGEELSYDQLNRRANRLAHFLRSLGVGPELRVGLCLERSVELLTTVLAVWKAGGVFLPLDPGQPRRRLRRMLKDAGLSVLVTDRDRSGDIPAPAGVRRVRLDAESKAIAACSSANPTAGPEPRHLAYVIFTSGSTGRPKGVMVEHASLVNLLLALEESIYGEPAEALRVAINAPLTFDAAIKQLVRWGRGDALYLIPEEIRPDGEALVSYLEQQRVQVLDCTPSQLRMLLAAELSRASNLQRVLVGGEAVDEGMWRDLGAAPRLEYFNVYGPTEATVDTTVCRIEGESAPSIGRPLGNVRVYVLDQRMRPVPLGLADELWIGGAGLSRGYADAPGQTAGRFVPDPFGEQPGGRLYRTGDRVRWSASGALEFAGRVDLQVKVRGFRVELGEIESVLEEYPTVGRAVVVQRDADDGHLVGYVVPRDRDHGLTEGLSRYPLPNGMTVALLDRVETDYLYREIFEERCYLRHGINLPEDAVVLDVGANIGMFTVFVGLHSPGARVYAFEPVPKVFEALEVNADLYGPEVHLFQHGLGSSDKTARFTFYPHFSARSGVSDYADPDDELAVIKRYLENEVRLGAEGADELLDRLDELLAGKFDVEEVDCRLRRLSDVIREQNLERIDLLKIDVQRSELDVLLGIDAEDWPKIEQLSMEVHDLDGARVEEILSLLRAQGFEATAEQDEMLRGTDRFNVFALRESSRVRARGRRLVPVHETAGEELYRLPNGLEVSQQNRNESEFIYEQIFRDRVYLQHGVSLPADAVVFDVGANIGLFTLFVHQACAQAQVYAFEPIPMNFEKLKRNVERYGLTEETKLNQAGLSSASGDTEMMFYAGWSAASGAYADEREDEEAARAFLLNRDPALAEYADEILEGRYRGERVTAKLRTVSEVMREDDIARIDLLKLDVEKSEWDVLLGIEEEDWPKIRQAVIEVHDLDGRMDAMRELLARHGFEVVVEQDALAAGTGIYTLYAVKEAVSDGVEVAVPAAVAEAVPTVVQELSPEALREFLRDRLPEHMVPQDLVVLDDLPFNRSGKVDRAALPAPEDVKSLQEREVRRARTPIEELLVDVWSEVLGVERIGVDDSFFELGGHSLLATQLIARVREAFAIDLPLRALFEAPTVETLASRVEEARRAGHGLEMPPIVSVARDEALPLSFAQQRMWFIDQLTPGNTAYIIPITLRVEGRLDRRLVERTLCEVVRRHEVLRSRFPDVGGRAVQEIMPPAPVPLCELDLSGLPDVAREAELRRRVRVEEIRPFDLGRGPLLRALLIRVAAEEQVVIVGTHHIVSDARSMEILIREVSILYGAFGVGQPSPLEELPVQYADFAAWQREWLHGEVLESELGYWRDRLKGTPPVELPADRPALAVHQAHSGHVAIHMPGRRAEVRRLSQAAGATPFMTLMAAYLTLLYRYSGQTSINVGTGISGRQHLQVHDLIGFFVNMLVIKGELSRDLTFSELQAQVRETVLAAFDHQLLPFEMLVQELEPKRDLTRQPLVQTAFSLNAERREVLELPGLTLTPLEPSSPMAILDLMLIFFELGDDLTGSLSYNVDLFDRTTAERLGRHFRSLVFSVLAAPECRLAELTMLEAVERHQLLVEWSDSESQYPGQLSIPEAFERQVENAPGHVAVELGDHRLTYRQLAACARGLARRLSLEPEEPVGLCLERGVEMVVGLLAVLEAGGAYVPLDPGYQPERLKFIMEDSGIGVVLTQESLIDRLPRQAAGRDVECVIVAGEDGAEDQLIADPVRASMDSRRLAYVTYTSGSTGRPKGIGVTHRAVARLVLETDYAQLDAGDRVAQVSSTTFDAATFEVWGALLNGATLVGLSRDLSLSPQDFIEELERREVSALFLTTALFNQMAREAPEGFRSLRHLLFGGENVDKASVARVLERGRPERLLHVYGPTESTTFTTWHRVKQVAATARTVPIGLPIRNTRVYVVDPRLRPVPIGAVGELVIGGDGLARGYHRRAGRTARSFVPDSVGCRSGARLYRTGDLVRRAKESAIEFIGRFDHQVKLRGFRVELGEIEAVLGGHPEVFQAVVVMHGEMSDDHHLVAYVVPEDARRPAERELKDFLKPRIPEYMLPSSVVVLDSLPLSTHGKVLRSELPDPKILRQELGEAFEPPRSETERKLAEIWSAVLQVERVGLRDDFFELGGHSLLATQLVSAIRRVFNVEITLAELFEGPTLEELARQVDLTLGAGGGIDAPPIEPLPRRDGVPVEAPPVSFAQQRLWFIDQLQPGMATYNMPIALRVRGELDPGLLACTLSEIVRRHEALRTVFGEEDGEPIQIVQAAAPVPLPVTDLSALSEEARQAEARRLVHSEVMHSFDLAGGPLIRAALVRLEEGDQAVVVNMHHIVSDGWSLDVMVREVAQLYPALATGGPSPLPPMPVQYGDFAVWQRRWLTEEVLEEQLKYWRQALCETPPLEMPTDRPRPAVQTYTGDSVMFRLSDPVPLRALAREAGATDFMALLASFQILLHRASGQRLITVGTPVAGRNRSEIENLIGFFVNSLVMKADFTAAPSFAEMLAQVKETAVGAFDHQDLPFEKLVEELQPERHLSHQPLFQTMFSSLPERQETVEVPGLTLEPLEGGGTIAKWELMLYLSERADEVVGALNYNVDLYDRSTATRLVRHLEALIAAATAEPQRPVSQLSVMSAPECQQLMVEWNDTASGWPRRSSIPEIFAAQAARSPESVAVELGDERLSYRELERRSLDLARCLCLETEAPVGLCAESGVEMVIAILAILRAGGTYLPLDPEYPPERLRFMAEDSDVRVILTQEKLLSRLPESVAGHEVERIVLGQPPTPRRQELPSATADPEQLAYVTYTSGSTGRPKGIGVPHRAVLRLVLDTDFAQLGPGDRVAQVANISFDAATFEVWGALLTGGTLVGVPREVVLAPEAFATTLAEQWISATFLTAALFNQIARQEPRAFVAFRHLLVGGEALDPEWIRKVLEEGPPARLLNGYGPTENTTFSACHRVSMPTSDARSIPIGRPIASSSAHVVDRWLRPVALGVSGELVVGGDGLARGYFGRPVLTAERFVPAVHDVGPAEIGARLYRTGDLVRRLASGAIDFLGRLDHQVKLRGFRIELGEIEVVLGQHPDVAEAAVVLSGEGAGRRLVAYVVAAAEQLVESELRAYLKRRMPDYMVPAVFVTMDSLPLSAHGKVDRRALPEPGGLRPEQATEYAAPRSPGEQMLSEIWSQVLKVERVGVHDNFFDLGGHSLLATRLMSRIRQAFDVELPLRTVFEAPTVAALAHKVEAARRAGGPQAPPLVALDRDRSLPLSFAQQRLWIIDQLQPGSPAYNMPIALRVLGRLQISVLRDSLSEIAQRHEVLRTSFDWYLGEPAQIIEPVEPYHLPVIDLSGLPPATRRSQAQMWLVADARSPFDLTMGCLFRTLVLRLSSEEHMVAVNMHHIISDAWSLEVLVQEISALYQALLDARPSSLAELPVQYADYAIWQREWLKDDVLAAEVDYWRGVLSSAPEPLDLPIDRSRPKMQSFRGGQVPVELNGARDRLNNLGRKLGATPFITLMAAFHVLLARYSGQASVNVGTPISGRNRIEIEGLIGFFVNTLVIRASCAEDPTFSEALGRVRDSVLGAFDHQDVPFEKLVEELQPERDLSRQPLFQAFFTLTPERQGALELPGLTLELVATDAAIDAKFDLSLGLVEVGDDVRGAFGYSADLFDPSTITRMARHFETMLQVGLEHPERRLSELPLLAAGERHQMQVEWGDRTWGTAPEASVLDRFEARAAGSPEAIALTFLRPDRTQESLSFAGLEAKANRLACRLRGMDADADRRQVAVGLCVERSPAVVVGFLGIWKAGAAYLPLEPSYPDARLSFLLADALEDASSPVVVTEKALESRLAGLVPDGTRQILLDVDAPEVALDIEPDWKPSPEDLAYLIYTSGTTGTPKAVMVEQRNLASTLAVATETFRFDAGDRMPCVAPFSFDIFLFELLGPMLTGGTSVLLSLDPTLDVARLIEELARSTQFHAVPSVMRQVVDGVREKTAEGRRFDSVKQVFVGGDAVPAQLLTDLRQVFPEARLQVLYGPTEGTIICSAHAVPASAEVRGAPIGRPLPGASLEVRDAAGETVPIGIVGELEIGGRGVTRGYLRREELTAERYPDASGRRVYRTGDLARWLPDGTLSFIGRGDEQVKVRGFRIELGEIEAVLGEHPAVAETAVVAREGAAGERRLVAYVVQADGEPVPDEDLQAYLRQRLPEYMVPPTFVALDALPLTVHGKVDRRALPEPGAPGSVFVAPRTPDEELLATIWREVLGVDKVGIYDSFFELGGHSLLATQVVSRIRQALGVELPLREVFEHPTIAGLARAVEKARSEDPAFKPPPLEPADRDRDLPLSFAQQRMWFIDRLIPDSTAYNMPISLRATGRPDVALIERCLTEIVTRHEVLRTSFRMLYSEPVQVVAPPGPVSMPVVDLSELSAADRESVALRQSRSFAHRRFDLARGKVFRVAMLRLAEDDHVVLMIKHHICSDGWSIGVLVRELTALYEAFSTGKPSPLPSLPVQYVDYAVWQRQWLRGEVLVHHLDYWRRQLAGAPPLLDLPTDRPRRAVKKLRGGRRSLELPAEVTSAMNEMGRHHRATAYMMLLAAFQALLSRYSGQRDIVLGTPLAGRTHVEIEGLIGLFVNTLVLRTDLSSRPDFLGLVRQARELTLEAQSHQVLPFEKLVEELQPQRSLSHTPLFQVMFIVQNLPESGEDLKLPGLTLRPYEPLDIPGGGFDLTFLMFEGGDKLRGSLDYNPDLFDATTIERLIKHFEVLLHGALADPERPFDTIPLLSASEQSQLVTGWNDTAAPVPPSTFHELFAARAARRPKAPALLSRDETLDYGQVDRRANRLAHRLRRLGTGPETLVAICLERSPEMAVAVLAVLKAGGAYLPLDPSYPSQRLSFMLEDSAASLLLTGGDVAFRPETEIRIFDFDAERQALATESAEPPSVESSGQRLAYVIYTSGSTGLPKGVMVHHAGLTNLALTQARIFGIEEHSRVLQFAALSFDASISEIAMALVSGAALFFGDRDESMPGPPLARLLQQRSITAVTLPPSSLSALPREDFPELASLVTAGEACPTELAEAWAGGRRMINAYGPTETTVCATASAPLRFSESYEGRPDIGRPITNLRAYVADARCQPVPIGAAGELLVSGTGVARGYLGRPRLSAERFVPDPFGGAGDRFYRTGDRVRQLADGRVDFLGRVDYQLKLRGYRIEPGEIADALGHHPRVREAAILTREAAAGEQQLVAYYVPETEALTRVGSGADEAAVVCECEPSVDADELRRFLKERLPEHMIPAYFVPLEALPMLPNGKVDRAALPAITRDLVAGVERVEPGDELEARLVEIWQEVLDIDSVGIHDNFFDLGGHSLLAVRLASAIERMLGKKLAVATIFQAPTIAELAELIRNDADTGRSLVPIKPRGDGPRLYLTHTASGNIFSYQRLAAAMHEDHGTRLYAFQAQGLGGDVPPYDRVEDMASHYIEELLQADPEGPYSLCGWSVGGVIAFEMAHQLEEMGREVAFLALLDSRVPTDYDRAVINNEVWILHLFARDFGISLIELGVSEGDILALTADERFSFVFEKAQAAGSLPAEIDEAQIRRLYGVFKATAQAMANYRPSTYRGSMTFVRSKEPLPEELRPDASLTEKAASKRQFLSRSLKTKVWQRLMTPALGWEKQVEGKLDVVEIGGHHFEMLHPPHLEALVEILSERMAKIDES